MRQPTKPVKPYTPSKPVEPEEFLLEKPCYKFDRYSPVTLEEVIACLQLGEPIDFSKIIIDPTAMDIEEDPYDRCGYIEGDIKVVYDEGRRVENPYYKRELSKYKTALKKYPKKLEKYEEKMEKYKKDLAEYEENLKEYNRLKEEKEIEEAKKVLRKKGLL